MVGMELSGGHISLLWWRIGDLGQGGITSTYSFYPVVYFYKQNGVPNLGICEKWLQLKGEGLETSSFILSCEIWELNWLPNTSKSALASRLPSAIDVFTIQLWLLHCSRARDVLQVAGTPIPALQNVPASSGFLLNVQFIAMVLHKCNSHLWGAEELGLQGWYLCSIDWASAHEDNGLMKPNVASYRPYFYYIFKRRWSHDGIQQVRVTQQTEKLGFFGLPSKSQPEQRGANPHSVLNFINISSSL